jgi:UDP-GlcNAc3NAcA epimerase
MPLKVVTVVGARPQFVKAAVVSRNVALYNQTASAAERISEFIVHTGQHFDGNMSDIFFEEMEIPRPRLCLGIHQLSHGAMTGRMMEAIEKVLLAEKPDVVLVYGDTNSTLAGALAAIKLHIPVAHVEAGLRSYNRSMPEEHNRVLTDHVSTLLFCPTGKALQNLEQEGILNYPTGTAAATFPVDRPRCLLVGDVMYDAALFYAEKAAGKVGIAKKIIQEECRSQPYAVLTLHRAENTDSIDRLGSIIEALETISRKMPIVWPIHPRTRSRLQEYGLSFPAVKSRILPIDPVGYFDMLELLKNCRIVLTDSGGLQKEAYFFGKPCVTLREETEWIELVDHGFNRIAGATPAGILEAFEGMIGVKQDFGSKLYGDGDAGEKIVTILARLFLNHR